MIQIGSGPHAAAFVAALVFLLGWADVPSENAAGVELTTDFLCYKVSCASFSRRPPKTVLLNDQFGTRTARPKKARTLCTPARKSCGTTAAPTCGGFCPAGGSCSDAGGTCTCS